MATDSLTTDERAFSIEEFERLPERDWRTELVQGRLVREPLAGYEHGLLANRISFLLTAFVREHRLGDVLTAETGFVLSEDPPTVRGPDVAFVAAERVPTEGPPAGFARFAPDLAVEVVSPSSRLSEVQDKALDYLDAGARLVWVVEPRARRVMVYRSRSDIRVLGLEEELDGGSVLPGFRLPVREIFEAT
jgi:Uma2 family endonuclease